MSDCRVPMPTYSKVMTPEEFKIEMQKIHDEYKDKDDPESCHIYMDRLMCDLLIDLGYWEGIDIFENTYKWYA